MHGEGHLVLACSRSMLSPTSPQALLAASECIKHLTVSTPNQQALGGMSAVTESVVSVIREQEGLSRLHCAAALAHVTQHPDNLAKLGEEPLPACPTTK